jgi:hypothetical protein
LTGVSERYDIFLRDPYSFPVQPKKGAHGIPGKGGNILN